MPTQHGSIQKANCTLKPGIVHSVPARYCLLITPSCFARAPTRHCCVGELTVETKLVRNKLRWKPTSVIPQPAMENTLAIEFSFPEMHASVSMLELPMRLTLLTGTILIAVHLQIQRSPYSLEQNPEVIIRAFHTLTV